MTEALPPEDQEPPIPLTAVLPATVTAAVLPVPAVPATAAEAAIAEAVLLPAAVPVLPAAAEEDNHRT